MDDIKMPYSHELVAALNQPDDVIKPQRPFESFKPSFEDGGPGFITVKEPKFTWKLHYFKPPKLVT